VGDGCAATRSAEVVGFSNFLCVDADDALLAAAL
jgi:hypothetical protein